MVDFTIPALQRLFGGSVFDARMQAEQTGKLVVSLLMVAALLVLGYKTASVLPCSRRFAYTYGACTIARLSQT